ncbi:hypothetical protein Riv7116_6576 [Rivularia sp. PCC 7116]|uniref:type II toxin-antitoxin system RelN family antitoxin n=1 Tax=Rivularia sp. PCC 7116 TaxID=373994 RepID=UPI00029EE504|nr:hypothetical protein [Rivularia sp. PCC 7116]AFY58903.1 hypothetical protein Riv7116_6576 [Rivularia sp. PCC 7116]
MKAIKAMGTIDEDGQLTLDKPITTDKNSRVEVIVLIREDAEIDEDDTPLEVIKENFRQAWDEAMSGQTIPASQIWDGIS